MFHYCIILLILNAVNHYAGRLMFRIFSRPVILRVRALKLLQFKV